MKKRKVQFLTTAAVIAALYAALTVALWQFSSLQIQCRLSEVLCVLPAFTPAAIPGLFLGCVLANLLGGSLLDVVFGSLATLLAALCSYLIGKAMRRADGSFSLPGKLLIPLPPVLFNAAIIPFVLYYGYGFTTMLDATAPAAVLALNALSVGLGEFLVCYILGVPFLFFLEKIRKSVPASILG